MLVYPQIISSSSSSSTPVATGDYPAIDTSNPLAAGLLWACDLTQYSRDTAQQEISGAAGRTTDGVYLDFGDTLSVPSPGLGSIYSTQQFAIAIHFSPSGWESDGEMIIVLDGATELVTFRRSGSSDKLDFSYPGFSHTHVYLTDGAIRTSATPMQLAVSKDTVSGPFIYVDNGVIISNRGDRVAVENAILSTDTIRIGQGLQGTIHQVYIFDRAVPEAELASLYSDPQQVFLAASSESSHPIIDTSNAIGADIVWLAYPELFTKDSNGNEPVLNGVSITVAGAEDSTLADYAEWPWPLGDLSTFGTGQFTIWYGGATTDHGSGSGYAAIVSLVDSGGVDALMMRFTDGEDIGATWPNGNEEYSGGTYLPGNHTSFAVTYDGSRLREYVDGTEVSGDFISSAVGSASIAAVRLGGGIAGTHKQAFFANRMLTGSEITSLHADPYQVLTNAS